jgi:hypothetical protein
VRTEKPWFTSRSRAALLPEITNISKEKYLYSLSYSLFQIGSSIRHNLLFKPIDRILIKVRELFENSCFFTADLQKSKAIQGAQAVTSDLPIR